MIPLFKEDAPSEELYELYENALSCRCLAHRFNNRNKELCEFYELQCVHYLNEIYTRDKDYFKQAKESIDDYYQIEQIEFV